MGTHTHQSESSGGVQARYAPHDDRPLSGYTALMATYGLSAGALAAAVRWRRPDRIGFADLALITVATHRLSRTLAKDAVTSPLRAPVARYEEPGLPSEVNEEVQPQAKGDSVRHAVGELVTCPFCLAQWVAGALVGSQLLAPRFTRNVTSVLTAVAGADVLHFLYAGLQRLES